MMYRVCGRNRFLGYEPGETFIADLDAGIEARALARGSIEIVGDDNVDLDPMRAELPPSWSGGTSTTKGD